MSAPAIRSLSYWTFQYKRTWRSSLAGSFLSPVLYLTAIGVGLGSLVNRHTSTASLGGVQYLSFLAPGLLASAAMQTAAAESTWPVLGSIKWVGTYYAMLASPLGVVDVLVGHLVWIALRITMVTSIFFFAMLAFGTVHSLLAIALVPAATLTGVAFAAPIAAFAATRENDVGFIALFRLAVVPMFLFSGTFYPLSQLPPWLRAIGYLTPLWHGVDLCRSLCLGRPNWALVAVHVAYLSALAGIGFLWAKRTFSRRLVK